MKFAFDEASHLLFNQKKYSKLNFVLFLSFFSFSFLQERCQRAEKYVTSTDKQQYPKQLYVASVSGSLGPNRTPEVAREDFERLMSAGGCDSYGYLVATKDSCWGIVGYVNEHWALPTETGLIHGQFEVQCTHQFVDTLKTVWNHKRSSCGRRFLSYKNVNTRMTNKSCNNFCLKNVEVKEERLQEIVDEYLSVE